MAGFPLLRTAREYWQASEVARRIALAREPQPDGARGPRRELLMGELGYLIEPWRRRRDSWSPPPAKHPRTVLLIPGFGAHPGRMRYLARQLEAAGHRAKRWGLGINLGAARDTIERLEERLCDIQARNGGAPVHLVGWSLGGVFARELAKRHPDKVAKVVTLGAPFSGHPRANNGWRAYHLIAGHRVEEPPIEALVSEKPPVETVALWSPRDGVVHPRSARGRAGERDRAVALRCTHMGFVHSREGVEAVLRELDSV
ncbi:esterase/lipase family protein [Qipengyuania sediminis]|uniref:esterase/lipase family protein n=1 Tax=Qipengyuania sediminis TaxID=1532023 RepID=UPI001059525D|nr:alpha/beta fold hydrolase [Qipengyuania sediminis]